ncbi:putative translation initiation factor eIF-2B subunit delta [Madurella mycetomatis]|uniref:Translation initiation factor eIF2B subunit delta n=1 Tax=Madurella mycetomatis TaxID=100816 RepID=A0A175WFR1_9PEZI|nr:putative translation initiation factor eIF-2B subunit delta [Madurella mycetomatis]
MAGESNGAPSGAPSTQDGSKSAPALTNPPAATANAEKLTPAQLKAKAKAEKAARRAQVKEARAATGAAPLTQQTGSSGADAKGGKAKGKQDGAGRGGRRPSMPFFEKDPRSGIPECFSHIPMAKRIQTSQAHKDVHPAVLAVGQQMATFALKDSIARLEATMLALQVIESYETPKGNSLSRHFIPHVLNSQIEYLTECRPMCFAMGNAIRLLKAKVNKFDINTPEDEAKEGLLEWIDYLLHERITLAEFVIARNAAQSINEGDTILTYGRHRLVEKTLLGAKKSGKSFDVTIIDDPYERGGQELAKRLRQAGIDVLYSPNLGGLRPKVAAASNVFLGGEAIFANGSLNAPSGTADVAMAAMNAGVKVIVLCETINFDRERISVDALTYNEIDPERNTADCFRLLFDNTHDKYITGVITEFESGGGNSPAQAILALLRKQEDPLIA